MTVPLTVLATVHATVPRSPVTGIEPETSETFFRARCPDAVLKTRTPVFSPERVTPGLGTNDFLGGCQSTIPYSGCQRQVADSFSGSELASGSEPAGSSSGSERVDSSSRSQLLLSLLRVRNLSSVC